MAIIRCHECGKTFERNTWDEAKLALSGHVMSRRDHYNKRWAKGVLLGANVGSGLWGDHK